MEAATAGFLEYGVLGIIIIICFGIIFAMWKHLHKERESHAVRMKEINEKNQAAIKEAQTHYAKERDAMRDKFDSRLQIMIENTEKNNKETLNKVIELTRDSIKTSESVKMVVEENTRAIERWGAKIDDISAKILVFGERIDKLEDK